VYGAVDTVLVSRLNSLYVLAIVHCVVSTGLFS
jgi:hypothetical protein